MSEAIDQLTVNWEEEGELRVKELKKHVLSKGAWATVMFLYQEFDKKLGDFRPPKITIRRYRKRNDQYMYQSKFNISSEAQGLEIARIIQEWYKPEAQE
ncbi:MAG: hypothetical protein KC505_10265 [Myxococcales bacterium]|nr:hypothetical protein [Myxococcales bacterium]USN51680.1 MAG: hypothetical protein H6731_04530 [Myxococcales bacterium]